MTETSIKSMIDVFCEKHPDAEYTFAHIILADYNIERSNFEYCYSLTNLIHWIQGELGDAKDGYELMDRIKLFGDVHEFLTELFNAINSGILTGLDND